MLPSPADGAAAPSSSRSCDGRLQSAPQLQGQREAQADASHASQLPRSLSQPSIPHRLLAPQPRHGILTRSWTEPGTGPEAPSLPERPPAPFPGAGASSGGSTPTHEDGEGAMTDDTPNASELEARFSPAGTPPSLMHSSAFAHLSSAVAVFEGQLRVATGTPRRRRGSSTSRGCPTPPLCALAEPPLPLHESNGHAMLSVSLGASELSPATSSPSAAAAFSVAPLTSPSPVYSTMRALGGSDSASSSLKSSFEQWDGLTPVQGQALGQARSRRLRVSVGGGRHSRHGSSSGGTSATTPVSRHTKRKRQQRERHEQASVVEQLQQQLRAQARELTGPPQPTEEPIAVPAETDTEISPLAACYRIHMRPPPLSTDADQQGVKDSPTAAMRADDAAAASASSPCATPTRWYRKRRVMVPLLCVLAVLLSALIALLVLYPQPPSITTTSVHLSDLVWREDPVTGALTSNLTMSVSLSLRNGNSFGSHFDETAISTFVAQPAEAGGGQQQVATLVMPAGYIGPKSELSLMLRTDIKDARLASAKHLVSLMQRMQVSAAATTHGTVSFLGIDIPYKVSTSCWAVCSVGLLTLEVKIIEQQCDSSAS